MGIGRQTHKIIDYCSTPVQLTGVIYDNATREALKKIRRYTLLNSKNNNTCHIIVQVV
ncbi:hypothetical protein Hanom_Chr08g00749731 [Helianthus anomalus]